MELGRAMEHAIDGHAVLFTGAGFAKGATNIRGEEFKTGFQLGEHFAKLLKLTENIELDDVADEFEQTFGEDRLIEELQHEFTAHDIAKFHEQIAQIGWRRIYTTNYDNVLETAFARVSRPLKSVTPGDRVRAIPKKSTLSVHLNGFVERLTRDTIHTEVKLTDSNYLVNSLATSSWAALFRKDIAMARAIFFLGYSLADLDVKRILYETPDLQEKCFFVVGTEPSARTIRRASRFGSVLEIDAEMFAAELTEKADTYSPPNYSSLLERCIVRYERPSEYPKLTDKDIFALLLFGHFNSALGAQSLQGGEPYFLSRSVVDSVFAKLESGVRCVVVHGSLGNGKSMILEGIKYRGLEEDYQIYTIVERTEDILLEIEQVLAREEKQIIVLDEYPDWLDVIEYLSVNAPDTCALVASARTAVHDVMVDDLVKMFPHGRFSEIPGDTLDDRDIEWVSDLLDRYGLWEKRASWSRERKIRFLESKCKRELHAILLMILESPDILARFQNIFDKLNQKGGYYDVVISILILAVLNRRPSIEILIEFWGEKILDWRFRRDPIIKQIVNVTVGEVMLRSSVAGEFILKNVANVDSIVDVLIHMAEAADRAAVGKNEFHYLITRIMRFRSVQCLLPAKGKRRALIRYYEGIKNLRKCKRNYLFWLQYAIACLVVEDLERAEKYFKTAYSYAKKGNNDPYQINNHFARFLLVKAVRSGDVATCMRSFRRAREIINRQIKKERLHYPYRVAILYAEFYDKFQVAVSSVEIKEVVDAADFVLGRIQALPDAMREHKHIKDCILAMEYVIEIAQEDRVIKENNSQV